MGRKLKVALWGASGVMGGHVIAVAQTLRNQGHDVEIVAGFVAASDPLCGKQLAGVKRPLLAEWSAEVNDAEVIIDFSSAAGSIKAVAAARAARLPIIVCATGHTAQELREIEAAAGDVAFIHARNTSVGVNATLKLVAEATRLLGKDTDIEISEIHHTRKKDSPSGTAKALGDAIAEARGEKLADLEVCGRAGNELSYRKGEIGFSAIRGGDTPGEHTVYFFFGNERIEITHRAMNRRIWADGALKAAQWLVGKKPGRYTMFDVLE